MSPKSGQVKVSLSLDAVGTAFAQIPHATSKQERRHSLVLESNYRLGASRYPQAGPSKGFKVILDATPSP